ncbi:hypothetical protein [Butyrivibrio sp. AC2005]|uniref:hypothetical protein n=1 Tax=Butyrivibrio sp. AC2005 TaxID=1280672 RepID=UPI00040BC141|nr:hypothetical protein [Butyrivibrio sp. AC2005]
MGELLKTLENNKKELLIRKQMLEEDIIKYSIPGYINIKNIRGRETFYLQFKDKYYQMISVYLSKDKLALCEYAFDKKTSLEAELKTIEEDLELLKNIPVHIDSNQSDKRILDDAIGLSAKYKLLFHIKKDAQPGKYFIVFYGKKKVYEIPMIYVNERYHTRISEYICSASCMVDEAADEMLKEKQTPSGNERRSSLEAQTKTGVKYSYEELDMTYLVSFYYKKKKYTIEYEPYFINEEKRKDLEISRMGFYVEDFLKNLKFKEGVSKYNERKQTVHSKTKKS